MNPINLRWRHVSVFISTPYNQVFVSWYIMKLKTSAKEAVISSNWGTWPAKYSSVLLLNSVCYSKCFGFLESIWMKSGSQPEVFYRKGVLKKIPQTSRESTCAGVSFLTICNLKVWLKDWKFSWELCELFKEKLICRAPPGDYFWMKEIIGTKIKTKIADVSVVLLFKSFVPTRVTQIAHGKRYQITKDRKVFRS